MTGSGDVVRLVREQGNAHQRHTVIRSLCRTDVGHPLVSAMRLAESSKVCFYLIDPIVAAVSQECADLRVTQQVVLWQPGGNLPAQSSRSGCLLPLFAHLSICCHTWFRV